MAAKTVTQTTAEKIGNISERLNTMAEQLAGVEPIARLMRDAGDEGDMVNALAALGGLCSSIFDQLSDAASDLGKLAKEGGAA